MNKCLETEIPMLSEIEQKSISMLKERLSKVFHLHSLILFGSKARGDYEEWSDVDVMVLNDTQLTCILENIEAWEQEADSIRLPMKDNIAREGIAIEV